MKYKRENNNRVAQIITNKIYVLTTKQENQKLYFDNIMYVIKVHIFFLHTCNFFIKTAICNIMCSFFDKQLIFFISSYGLKTTFWRLSGNFEVVQQACLNVTKKIRYYNNLLNFRLKFCHTATPATIFFCI